MIGGVTLRMLPHLSGVPHLHVKRPLVFRDRSIFRYINILLGEYNALEIVW